MTVQILTMILIVFISLIIYILLCKTQIHFYNIYSFFEKNIIKISIIFIIGFMSRLIISTCTGINVFIDYTKLISLLYYFSFSSFIVYVNSLELDLNNFTIKKFSDGIKILIHYIVNNKDLNKMTMNWEGISYSEENKKCNINIPKTTILFSENNSAQNSSGGPSVDLYFSKVGLNVDNVRPSVDKTVAESSTNKASSIFSPLSEDLKKFCKLGNPEIIISQIFNISQSSNTSLSYNQFINAKHIVSQLTYAIGPSIGDPIIKPRVLRESLVNSTWDTNCLCIPKSSGSLINTTIIFGSLENPSLYPLLSFPTSQQNQVYNPFYVQQWCKENHDPLKIYSFKSFQNPHHLPELSLSRKLEIYNFLEKFSSASSNNNIKLNSMSALLQHVEKIYGRQASYALGSELRKVFFNDPGLRGKYMSGRLHNSGILWGSIPLKHKGLKKALTT